MGKTSEEALENAYPTVADFIRTQGWIEIGDQEGFGFVVRASDYGGVVFATQAPKTLTEAMTALEQGIAEFLRERG